MKTLHPSNLLRYRCTQPLRGALVGIPPEAVLGAAGGAPLGVQLLQFFSLTSPLSNP